MINVEMIKTDPRAQAPRNAYGNDAGWDLFVLEDTEVLDFKGGVTDVHSGIAIALPEGYYARIVGRSSALRKRGVVVHESTIDAGFRGELFAACSLLDPYDDTVTVEAGASIAQLIVQEVRPVRFVEVEQLPESRRGERGFGSSDIGGL